MIKFLDIFKNSYLYLILILILCFSVRLYKIDSPIADWHSWRQADTAAVSRNFYQEGFNPFIPRYDNLIGESGDSVNLSGYRFVEFPIYNSVVYFFYLLNGGVDEKLARLVSIFASLGSTVFIFLIVRKFWGKTIALLSSLIFALLPFNIYFSRVILPEPSLVFFSLGMFYFTERWIWENKNKLLLLSILFAASAFLTKPTAIFYLLPLVYSYYQKEKKWWPIPSRYYLFILASLTPLLLWRVWVSRFPEGIPASGWLLNGDGIRFKPAYWRWIIGDRLGREILTVSGLFLFLIGLLVKSKPSEGIILHLLALSSLGYLAVIATGNVKHDYYQTFIIPALVIFTARGFILLTQGLNNFVARLWTIPLAILFLFLTLYIGWIEVRGLYQINNGVIVEAGNFANQVLPKDAKVLAPYGGDTAFLYQVNRPGFAMQSASIEDMIESYGITHYISVNFDDQTNKLIKEYTSVEINPKFVILDLKSKNINYLLK